MQDENPQRLGEHMWSVIERGLQKSREELEYDRFTKTFLIVKEVVPIILERCQQLQQDVERFNRRILDITAKKRAHSDRYPHLHDERFEHIELIDFIDSVKPDELVPINKETVATVKGMLKLRIPMASKKCRMRPDRASDPGKSVLEVKDFEFSVAFVHRDQPALFESHVWREEAAVRLDRSFGSSELRRACRLHQEVLCGQVREVRAQRIP